MEIEYVYSLNNEQYYDIDSFLDMLDNMHEDSEQLLNQNINIYKAEKVLYTSKSFFNINSLLENISQNAYDMADEYAEDYCNLIDNLKQEYKDELTNYISTLLDEAVGQPKFFTVKNYKQILYKDIDAST